MPVYHASVYFIECGHTMAPPDRMRLKDRIIDNISKAIKSIQELVYYQYRDPLLTGSGDGVTLYNDDRVCHKLCENLDHTLLHGLKHVMHGYWPVVRQLSPHVMVKEIDMLVNVTTDLGRGRAWLYASLNEGLLESYVRLLCDNDRLLRKYYAKEALVLDKDRMSVLMTLASGLDCVTFHLDYDMPYLDLNAYPPRSRSNSDHETDKSSESSLSRMGHPSRFRSRSEVSASSPESACCRPSDSDSASVASLDIQSNSGCACLMKDSTISADSGCPTDSVFYAGTRHVTGTPIEIGTTRRQSTASTDALSLSSVSSLGDQDKHQRLQNIVLGDEEVSGPALEVIHVKGKKSSTKCKKKKQTLLETSGMPGSVKKLNINEGTTPACTKQELGANSMAGHSETFDINGEVGCTASTEADLNWRNDAESDINSRAISKTYESIDNLSTTDVHAGANAVDSLKECSLEITNYEEIDQCGKDTRECSLETVICVSKAESCITSLPNFDPGVEVCSSAEHLEAQGSYSQGIGDSMPDLAVEGGRKCRPPDLCDSLHNADSLASNRSDGFDSYSAVDDCASNTGDFTTSSSLSPPSATAGSQDSPFVCKYLTNKDSNDCACVVSQDSNVSELRNPTPNCSLDIFHTQNLDNCIYNEVLPNEASVETHRRYSPDQEIENLCDRITQHMQNTRPGELEALQSVEDEDDLYASYKSAAVNQGHIKSTPTEMVLPIKENTIATSEPHLVLETEAKVQDLSLRLDNNTKLGLMLDVFTGQDERIIKMFATRMGHTEGNSDVVFLLISDQHLYILDHHSSGHRFVQRSSTVLTDLIFISAGMNGQTLNIESRGKSKQKHRIWLTPGHQYLTRAIMTTLMCAVQVASEHTPLRSRFSVGSEVPLQKIALRKYVSRELHCEPHDVTLHDYSHVFLEDLTSVHKDQHNSVCKEGALLLKVQESLRGHVWKPVYVVLRKSALSLYNCKSDLQPYSILGLGGDQCVGCRLVTQKDQGHCVELILATGGSWTLSATSQADIANWSHALCLAVSRGTEEQNTLSSCIACSAVLACGSLFLCHEDLHTKFCRTLAVVELKDVAAVVVDALDPCYFIIKLESGGQWVLYFSSAEDLDRHKMAVSSVWKDIHKVELPTLAVEEPSLLSHCRNNLGRLREQLLLR